MYTLAGEIPEENLRKVTIREPISCGTSVITQYFYGEELVRQDCEIIVTQGLTLAGESGEV